MKAKKAIYELKDPSLEEKDVHFYEAIFHNANGYIGARYDFEEGYPEDYKITPSQYINGFYDDSEMSQAEKLYGLASEKQSMINVADTQEIRLFAEGEEFSMYSGEVTEYRLTLDMNRGFTERNVKWISPRGRQIALRVRRMASFRILPLFTIEYNVTPLNFSGEITIESAHEGNVLNYVNSSDPRTSSTGRHIEPVKCVIIDGASYITSRTIGSGLEMCSCVRNAISQSSRHEFRIDGGRSVCSMKTEGEAGREIKLIKYCVMCDSIRYRDCLEAARTNMNKALTAGIDKLYSSQKRYLDKYWANCYVTIKGDDELSQALAFNMYQLNQSVSKDRFGNIAPKGLSGDGYEGQYFWDTEMFSQPFFAVTNPSISKALIGSRYEQLELARENARIMGHEKGALYPWRTITGKECSGYFPAGSAQYHINADIAHSIIVYYLVTKDLNFIASKGAEIIFETARLWMDTGNFYNGQFHINDVTGPDEYTCIVNNNYYTNAMAKDHLRWAVKIYRMLEANGLLDGLPEKIRLRKREIEEFTEAAEKMYLPYDEEMRINPQDDSFLQKKEWNIADIPKDRFPLLMHYHPLYIYRHRICKQADTVMAYFTAEEEQDEETMRNSFLYYENVTTHDSSLSKPVFSIVASRLGMKDKAYRYFGDSAKLDLLDLSHNTHDGIHTANMAGSFMTVVYGFGGFRINEDGISFAPSLPDKWNEYRFKVMYEGSRIKVTVKKNECTFSLERGDSKRIKVYGKKHRLEDKFTVKMR